MKKFMILLCMLCAPAFAAVETQVVNVGALATVTDINDNVWVEAKLSKALCGGDLIVTSHTNEKDVGFFRMRTLLSQSNVTNILAEIAMDCDSREIVSVKIQ